MIRIVADNFVKAQMREKFLGLAKELVEGTRTEAGNIKYNLHVDKADENHLTFIEEWVDADAIKAHNESEHFTRLVPQMAECAEKPGTCYLYEEIM